MCAYLGGCAYIPKQSPSAMWCVRVCIVYSIILYILLLYIIGILSMHNTTPVYIL